MNCFEKAIRFNYYDYQKQQNKKRLNIFLTSQSHKKARRALD